MPPLSKSRFRRLPLNLISKWIHDCKAKTEDMKKFFLHIIFLVLASNAYSQLYIGPGAQVQLTGNAQLTLKDVNFINNGNFSAGNSVVYFSGSNDAFIDGTQPVQFFTIQINKSGNHQLTLQRATGVSSEVQFAQGLINLNSNNLDLGSTGLLSGETEASRIVGASGGEVLFNTVLNAPSNANPANLGGLISSTQNLGNVLIRRGHQSQNISGGSILRYYKITPANNAGLNATLRSRYFDAELNGLTENSLVQWRSEDGTNWAEQGFTSRDAAGNYVEKTGINAFSTWTLATSTVGLPVIFSGFNLRCNNGAVSLQWKTAQEFNSSHFAIERNTGLGWTAIATVPAAGNSNVEKTYSFTDNNPATGAQYRIAQYDFDGKVKYTSIVRADCDVDKDALQAWPNPFQQIFTIRIDARQTSAALLKVMDAGGRVIINRQVSLQRGINQFELNLQKAAVGVYMVTVEWANGQQVKTMRLIKQ